MCEHELRIEIIMAAFLTYIYFNFYIFIYFSMIKLFYIIVMDIPSSKR